MDVLSFMFEMLFSNKLVLMFKLSFNSILLVLRSDFFVKHFFAIDIFNKTPNKYDTDDQR